MDTDAGQTAALEAIETIEAIVYLHGYASSPGSTKAQCAKRWFTAHYPRLVFEVPELPVAPAAAIETVAATLSALRRRLTRDDPTHDDPTRDARIGLIGSSLGGYYAQYFAERENLPAVLVNPAVYPHELLYDYLGEQVNPVTGERFVLEPRHIDELRALFVERMTEPSNRMVLVQSGDETLDYREAARYFAHSVLHVEQGGDHSFAGFENWLPRIALFFGLLN